MIIATRKECIQAARQYVRRLGRAQRSLGVMARQMKDLQRELDRMDGLGSSGDMRGGGHARGGGRQSSRGPYGATGTNQGADA